MTLIPLISALSVTPERAFVVATGYDPGAGHRPIAAAFAIGLPAALVVAVALSPMIVEPAPVIAPIQGTLIELPPPPAPPPDPKPEIKAQPKSAQATETLDTLVKLPTAPDNSVIKGPPVLDPPPPIAGPVHLDPAPPKLVLVEVDPRFAGQFQPEYPLREQRAGLEGSVTLRVLIGTDGRVKAVELVRADRPGFFEAAKKRALSKWRFRPATRGGTPEESWKEMTVRFQIQDG